jgi:hypothetical protein
MNTQRTLAETRAPSIASIRADTRSCAARTFCAALLLAMLALGTASAWTCFTWAWPTAKYVPVSPPWCPDGQYTTPPDPEKGWQCYKYYIEDADYAWGCVGHDDDDLACQKETTNVTVTERAGMCTEGANHICPWTAVLHYKEVWYQDVGHQRSGQCSG